MRSALSVLPPAHDTPIGIVHPYWARKPMNTLELIIRHLTEEGDVVVDPFMGSGTTIFAALQTQRAAIGSDISALSQHLVSGLLDIIENAELVIPEIRRILDAHSEMTLPWFEFESGIYVERVRFKVNGEFRDGLFTLEPTEVVTKHRHGGSWMGRKAHTGAESLERLLAIDEAASYYIDAPINFDTVSLQANSRIAIPHGATLAHYFTAENRASINALLKLIQCSPLFESHSAALKLVLSASLPTLRLSDRKASSQWPYWRPKTDLTSRNPVIVLESKYKQITELVKWASGTALESEFGTRHKLLTSAAQMLTSDSLGCRAKLVLTDPPYGDQVPYLEYSAMWNGVLGLNGEPETSSQELVRSDANHRRSDSSEYLERLRTAFIANARLLEQDGFLAWFYQDQDLRCWKAIYDASVEANLRLLDVIPLAKQRRSLKTVTSPNSTLDGDLLCIFTADNAPSGSGDDSRPFEQVDGRSDLGVPNGSYFDRYAVLISSALRSGDIGQLADKYKTVKRALAAVEE
nr:DNA methyltransferase [Arthrobacter pigmenti]